MTQPKAPREWRLKFTPMGMAFVLSEGTPHDDYVHVIEYSAYAALKEELEKEKNFAMDNYKWGCRKKEKLTAARQETSRLTTAFQVTTVDLVNANAKVAELEKALAESVEQHEHFADLNKEARNIIIPALEKERDELKAKGEQLCVLGGNQMLLLNDCEKALSEPSKTAQMLYAKVEELTVERDELGGKLWDAEVIMGGQIDDCEKALEEIANVVMHDDWGETTRWCRRVAQETLTRLRERK